MAKGILEFNLEEPFEENAFKRATKATDAYLALFDIANNLFRPYRKHGYADQQMQKLFDDNEAMYDLMEKLEEMFYEIMERYNVSLDELD